MSSDQTEREERSAAFLSAWCSDATDESLRQALLDQLEEDEEFRREVAMQVGMLGALHAAQASEPRWLALQDELEAGESDGHSLSDDGTLEETVLATIREWPHPARRGMPRSWRRTALRAAAAIVVVGSIAVALWRPSKGTPPIASVKPTVETMVAHVLALEASPGTPLPGFHVGDTLTPCHLDMADGTVTLQTLKGVSITLVGRPLVAQLVGIDDLVVEQGSVRVRVEEGGEGFRVRSPLFEVIDLGTEFAAEVYPDGGGRVRVFEGEADVRLLDSFNVPTLTQRLTKDHAVVVDPMKELLRMVEDDPESYPALALPPPTHLALAADYSSRVLDLRPASYWRFETMQNRQMPNEVQYAGTGPLGVVGDVTLARQTASNSAACFAGGEEHVRVLTANKFPRSVLAGNFTLCFWVNMSWPQNFALVSAHRFNKKGKGISLLVETLSAVPTAGRGVTVLHVAARHPPAWTGGSEFIGNFDLRPRKWHHLAVVRDDDRMRLFVAGKKVWDEHAPQGPLEYSNLLIGRLDMNRQKSASEARAFAGYLDELAIFPKALRDKQIEHLFNGGSNVIRSDAPKQSATIAVD